MTFYTQASAKINFLYIKLIISKIVIQASPPPPILTDIVHEVDFAAKFIKVAGFMIFIPRKQATFLHSAMTEYIRITISPYYRNFMKFYT